MKIEQHTLMIKMPDFLPLKRPFSLLKQDGFNLEQGFPVEQLTPEQAEAYSEEMKIAFMEHWKEKQRQ